MEKYGYSPSLQAIARLPISDRYQLLEKHVAGTAADFANHSALTEFSEVDIDDWDAADGEA
ncbi:MAG: hypothetical protein DCF15_19345 [Phormidesmis priestleyi]|uniref:DUF2281 domain-containing protein n=1 Tax=Phormidesmis priestleyi TaxID=268141 RepID=A0A2W4YJ49_9CYAN|nr:MAG: hypothetical protein DCF15_19345 [Phormidesmis priestleyi]